MDQRFRKINMDDVRNIIDRKGFYYLPLSRVYDEFKGCKYIIVAENPYFAQQNPQYADEIIMTVRQFEPYAEIFNTFLANEDRERKRNQQHLMYEEDDGLFNMNKYNNNPVEDKAIADFERERIHKALEQLTQTQRRRLELFFFYGWTERQIAEYEGINRYAVRTSLDSAIKKLKKIL